MAPSKACPMNGMKLAVLILALLISSTIFLSAKSVNGLVYPSHRGILQDRKLMVLGSRPPGCVNRCSSCRPCMATLVVPSHQRQDLHSKPLSSHGDEDDTYYLLSWKCRCGDKIFQP